MNPQGPPPPEEGRSREVAPTDSLPVQEPSGSLVRSVVLEPVEEEAVVSRRTAFIVIGVAIVLLIAAVAAVPHFTKGSSSGSAGQPQLATAAISSFPVSLTTSGTVVPNSEVSLNFSNAGQVSAINVKPGQKVTAGTVLATISDPGPSADLARAQGAVAAANSALAAAETPLDPGRAAQLQAAITAAQSTLEQANTTASATASTDAAAVAADMRQLAADQAQGTADGCVASSPSNALVCQDNAQTVTNDQGRLQVDQARQSSDASTDQARITQAQTQLGLANAAYQAAATPNASQVSSAQAGVSSANAELAAAQAEVAALNLTAPTSGTVLQINGQVGETVSGAATGSETLPGTNAPIPAAATPTGAVGGQTGTTAAGTQPFIVLGDSGSYVVGAAFPSGSANQLVSGQTGTLVASTLSGASIPCHVLAVAQTPSTVNGQSVVYASIIPDGSEQSLTSGLDVSVTINISQANAVLAVPQSAVYLLGGKPHVDVWNGKQPVSTPVTTGAQGSTLVQITSGLNAGEQVVLSADQGLPQSAATSGS